MNEYTYTARDGGGTPHTDAILLGDIITTAQFADTRKRADDAPEHQLIAATLADAIEVFTSLARNGSYDRHTGPLRKWRLWAETGAWIRDTRDAPFSFVWCCQALGLNPDAVRERLTAHNGRIVFSREQRGDGHKLKVGTHVRRESHSVRRCHVGPRRKSGE